MTITDRQTNRCTVATRHNTHIKSAQIKWGYKSKVLVANVLNPKIMSVGVDNNRQTDRQMYTGKNAQTQTKECSNQMRYKNKVQGLCILNPRVISDGEDNNRQTDKHTVAKRHKLV